MTKERALNLYNTLSKKSASFCVRIMKMPYRNTLTFFVKLNRDRKGKRDNSASEVTTKVGTT